jgi:hypothetical protein
MSTLKSCVAIGRRRGARGESEGPLKGTLPWATNGRTLIAGRIPRVPIHPCESQSEPKGPLEGRSSSPTACPVFDDRDEGE